MAKQTQICPGRRRFSTASRRRRNRNGLSLLEVLLSIAILGGAMVMIGQLYHLGYRSAIQARLRNDANIIADSKMAELAAGVLPLESAGNAAVEEFPGWSYSVNLENSLQMGLFLVTVSVNFSDETANNPVGISIKRFIPDPDYEPEEAEE